MDVRTSLPVEAWPTTTVTVLGDAQRGRLSGQDAVAGYEAQMRRYGFHAVAESRKQFDNRGALHRPVVGRVALGAMRTGLRVVNNVPLLKRRMINAESGFRSADHVAQSN